MVSCLWKSPPGPRKRCASQRTVPGVSIASGQWYFVAVVGSGPNNPVQFFVSPVSDSTITDYDSANPLAGSNGTYDTDANHDLYIGGRSNSQQSGAEPFNGEMVNQAVFNTALTPAQIQQLFLYGKQENQDVGNQLPSATPPMSVSLTSPFDTGVSNSDGITQLNNSSPSTALQI